MQYLTCTVVLMTWVSLAAAVPTYFQKPPNHDKPPASQAEVDAGAYNCIYHFSTQEEIKYIGPGSLLECLQQLEEATGQVPRIQPEHSLIVQAMVNFDYWDCLNKQRFPSQSQCREETTRGSFTPQNSMLARPETSPPSSSPPPPPSSSSSQQQKKKKPPFSLLQTVPEKMKSVGQNMVRYLTMGSRDRSPHRGSGRIAAVGGGAGGAGGAEGMFGHRYAAVSTSRFIAPRSVDAAPRGA